MFRPVILHQYLQQTTERFADKTALICDDRNWTYRDLSDQSDRLATGLVESGIRRQDRVIILLDTCAETVVSLFGISKAGGVFVILNGGLKAGKLAYIQANSQARFVITHVSKAPTMAEAFATVSGDLTVLWIGSTGKDIPDVPGIRNVFWDTFVQRETGPSTGLPRLIDQDLAALIYTSGSTGEPKGVMSTHQNMISAASSIIEYIQNTPDDIILDVLPLSFDYGLYQVIMSCMFGGTVVLEKSLLYFHNILTKIPQYGVTGFPIVPTIVAMLLKMSDLSRYDFSSLRYITNTGAALPVEHIRRFRALFPTIRIYSMFGLTECKRVCYLPPDQIDIRPASVGKAIPNCETLIINENGEPVKSGEIGELVIRGSNVMRGYWRDPDLTARTYRTGNHPGDRWLYSGDYFRQDEEGYLYFLGRKDDMIKTRGERVSPKEVENILSHFPGVAEVAVIGIPDEILGQAVAAFIVPVPGTTLTENDILRQSTWQMEIFMVPKHIRFIENIPKTPNGKIDKTCLKSMEIPQP